MNLDLPVDTHKYSKFKNFDTAYEALSADLINKEIEGRGTSHSNMLVTNKAIVTYAKRQSSKSPNGDTIHARLYSEKDHKEELYEKL